MLTKQAEYLETNGVKLHYQVTGEGPPLVLVHAGIADQRMWDPQVEALADRYQVIRYDLRGFGKSVSEPVPFAHHQDLLALVTHLRLEPAALIGISFGGSIAMNFALEHPQRCRALVMVASTPGGFEPSPPTEAEQALFDREEALNEARDAEGLADLDLQIWVDGPGQPAGRAAEGVRRKVREMALANYRNYFERYPPGAPEPKPQRLQPPATERLAELTVPTLVLTGDLDVSDIGVAADRMVETIPHARRVDFPGVAHMISMEKPAEFNRAVLEFLNEVERG